MKITWCFVENRVNNTEEQMLADLFVKVCSRVCKIKSIMNTFYVKSYITKNLSILVQI